MDSPPPEPARTPTLSDATLRYEALQQVTRLVNEETDLQQVLLGIRAAITSVLGFDRCGLFLINEEAGILQGTWGTDEQGNVEDISSQRLNVDYEKGPLREIALGSKPYVFIPDLREDQIRYDDKSEENATRVRENGIVAARARGKLLGILAVDNLLTQRPFTEEDIRHLVPFADQAGLAIHNAQLLAESRRRAEELESFVYAVSHDLRAPLVSIEGYADGLLRMLGESLAPNARYRLERILINAAQLQTFISDVLTYSRASVSASRQSISLTEVFQGVAAMLKPTLDEREIEFTMPEDLPEVFANPVQLHQVFLNLIDNAIKHTKEVETPRVEVRVRELPTRWNVAVADNGSGIRPEDLERIFQLFQVGKETGGGHGVGLATVKKIVEAHGGQVWAESQGPGQGATFVVSLPRGEDGSSEGAASGPDSDAPSGEEE